MLEQYKEDYPDFYTIMNNAINENKISHAYMFEIDENLDKDKFINDICKTLIVRDNDNDLLKLIDSGNYPNIKQIKADGLWIKKEQILDIQNDFRKESFDNHIKIYIIEDATKLNKSSANTLLKFLEEPEENIVAILLTDNKYSVIKTIMSRCINISLKKKSYIDINTDDMSYKIVELIETYKQNALPYLYQTVLKEEYERTEFIEVLEKVQKIYSDLLHINNAVDEKYNYFKSDNLKNINFEKDNSLIIKKIEAISQNIDYLKYNVNIKTILDKIIIEVYGGD